MAPSIKPTKKLCSRGIGIIFEKESPKIINIVTIRLKQNPVTVIKRPCGAPLKS
jgi:hypothetical protein